MLIPHSVLAKPPRRSTCDPEHGIARLLTLHPRSDSCFLHFSQRPRKIPRQAKGSKAASFLVRGQFNVRDRSTTDIREDFRDLIHLVQRLPMFTNVEGEMAMYLIIGQLSWPENEIIRIVRSGVCQGSKGHSGNVLDRDERHCAVLHRRVDLAFSLDRGQMDGLGEVFYSHLISFSGNKQRRGGGSKVRNKP